MLKKNSKGELVPSSILCHEEFDRTNTEKNFLMKIGRNILPSGEVLEKIYEANPNSFKNFKKKTAISNRFSKAGTPVTWKVLVICVDYPDLPATETIQSFNEMMNKAGYEGGFGSTGSFNDYYREVSYGQFGIDADVTGWFHASKGYQHYAHFNGMIAAQELVEEALVQAEASGVDFSQYDNDGDGYVDQVIIIHSGHGVEERGDEQYIWSHKWNLSASGRTKYYYGVIINDYTIQPEKQYKRHAGIGMYAHEFGNALGLPDLYDYDNSSEGIGHWGLMGSSAWLNYGRTPGHFCAWSKMQLGWVQVDTLSQAGALELLPAEDHSDQIKLIQIPTASTEYFLLENRQKTKFDQYLPGSGLLILHIDESVSNNNNKEHKMVDVEEADGKDDLDNAVNRGDAGDLFPGTSGNKNFTDGSIPNSRDYAGHPSTINIQNISEVNGNIQANITFAQLATGTVTGVVKDQRTGEPINGAKVFFDNKTVVTGSDGLFSFTDVVEGTYTIRVKASRNYEYINNSVSVAGNETTKLGVEMMPGETEPVYVDVADITCTPNSTWHYFEINSMDFYKDVGFGLWYYANDPEGPSFRLETYAKDVVGRKNGNNSYLTPLIMDDEIGENSAWVTTGEYPDEPFIASRTFTDWFGKTAYAGVKIYMDGFLHYGWFRLHVSNDGRAVTLLDYGFNNIPDGPIRAGQKTIAGVNDQYPHIPEDFMVLGNYPNPFNPVTRIKLAIPEPSMITIRIYNALGQLMEIPVENQFFLPGVHEIQYIPQKLSTGIYFYQVSSNSLSGMKTDRVKKMVLLR